MNRILLVCFLLLNVRLCFAQLPQKIGGPQGYEITAVKGANWMIPPSYSDTPVVPVNLKITYRGAIVLRTVSGDTSYWGWTGYKWQRIGSSVGGGGTPTLQEVTDAGNTTTTQIGVNNIKYYDGLNDNYKLQTYYQDGEFYMQKINGSSGGITTTLPINYSLGIGAQSLTNNRNIYYPDSSGTIPVTIYLNGSRYTANSKGQINLGTIGGGSMVYPGAGIPVSTGSAWGTSLTGTANQLLRRNAANTAYEFFTHDFLSTTGNGSGLTGLTKSQVGLGNVDNTSDANKPISTATQSALNLKQNTITTGTTSQYLRGDLSLATFPTALSSFTNDAGFVTASSTNTFTNKSGNISQWTNNTGYITNIPGDSSLSISNRIIARQPQLNGTGFVKATGTTISYDNSTYLTTTGSGSSLTGVIKPADTLTMLDNRISNIVLNTSGVLHSSPVTFSRVGGTWTGSLTLANQSAFTILRRASGSGTPSFGSIDSNYFNNTFKQQVTAVAAEKPTYTVYNCMFSDFIGTPTPTNAANIPGSAFYGFLSGGSMAKQSSGIDGLYGIQRCGSGTSAGSYSNIANSNGIFEYQISAIDTLIIEARFQIIGNPATSNTWTGFFGLNGVTAFSTPTITNGLGFMWDEQGSATGSSTTTNWQVMTASVSNRTYVTTSSNCDKTIYKTFCIKALTGSVRFFIDGVQVGSTITTNIPSTLMTPQIGITKVSGGTAGSIDIDYLKIEYRKPL